jgi:hypothetical protein
MDELRTVGITALPVEQPVVPVESLAYDPEPEVVPIHSLAPDAAEAQGGIEASFRTFDRLMRQRRPTAPSLEGLLGGEAVAIDTLVYRGQAALQRAVTVRHQITVELTREASLESLQPLLQELLDLVPLALEQS